MNDPLDSAIPVGSGPGQTVPPENPLPAAASAPPPTPPLPPAADVPPPPPATARAALAPSGNDKIWAILSHLSCLVGIWFIVPLVVYLAMRNESAYASENAKEALNFHISLFIYVLCSIPLAFMFIGIPLLVVLGIGALILSIVAAVKAADGAIYRYPLTIRLIK